MGERGPSIYFRTSLLHYLLNPYSWFWGVVFMSFWAAMSAFVFSKGTPEQYLLHHFGSTYGQLLILCVGSVAIGIVNSLYYSSFSVRFITKYSKLSTKRFYVEHFLSTIIALMIFALVLWLLQVSFYFIKFGEVYLPKNPVGTIFAVVISVCFIYAFSMFETYVVICLRRPLSAIFDALPLMLSFIAYAAFWIDFKIYSLAIPFYLISAIMFYFYTNQKPFTGDIIGNIRYLAQYDSVPKGAELDPILAIASMILWTIALSIASIFLIKKAKGVSIEEIQL